MDVESAFDVVGTMGRFQKFIVGCHFVFNIPYGMQMVFMVMAGATPNPHIPSEQNMTTIVTEWHLQHKAWVVDLISSLFMGGYGLGCIVMGQVSDLYGRKKTFLINFFIMQVATFCCYFAQSWETFAALRTICGIGAGGSGHVLFALLIENIGKKHWGVVGMVYSPFFSIGMMCLSLLGYTLQSWRTMCLVVSLVPLIVVPPLYIFILPESSRWLYNVGKLEEAQEVLEYIAKKNGLPGAKITLSRCHGDEEENLKKYSLVDMFSRKKLVVYAVCSFYIWFACSFVYYGLTLDAASLTKNIFLANALSGAIECPAYFVSYFTIKNGKIGRKGTLFACFVVSCIASIGMLIASGVTSDTAILSPCQLTLGLANKLVVAAAFSILYIYTAEVFPTQLRLVAIGGSSFFARIGAILSPFVPLLAPILPYLSFMVFGIVVLLSMIVVLFLPETVNKPSPKMSDFDTGESEWNNNDYPVGVNNYQSNSDVEPLLTV